MDDELLFSWTTEHRHLFADTVDELGEEHAGDPTLCEGWDVRTLTGHMLQPIHVSSWRFLLTSLRVQSMAKACDVFSAQLSDRPLGEVTAELRALAHVKKNPMFIGPAGPYVDTCIHLRDLAHPQGLDVTVPVERWKVALDVIVSPRGQGSFVPRRGMLKGLRWQATDTDRSWAWGDGPVVEGTAEALAMTMSGRTAYLDQLCGDGVTEVTRRLG